MLAEMHVRVVILSSGAGSERKQRNLLRQAITRRSDLWQYIGSLTGSNYEIFAAL